jgi:NAD(P)-dependent dehydrogenase (short-subunit alcohol dehydrogenase family)
VARIITRTLVAIVFIAWTAAGLVAGQQPATGVKAAATVLITGSNRGLGLEFTKQYAARGWKVIATARNPESATELNAIAATSRNVTVDKLDVADVRAIKALAAKYKGTPIDVLINNAGVLGDMAKQVPGAFDKAEFDTVMDVNVFGALATADAFLEHVAASGQKKIVSITSRSGIISQPGRRGPSYYRASKIALNMVMKVLADDLRDRGIIVAVVSPPPTDTDMLKQLIGPQNAAFQGKVPDTIAGLVKVIDGLTMENSGGAPVYFDGTVLPW